MYYHHVLNLDENHYFIILDDVDQDMVGSTLFSQRLCVLVVGVADAGDDIKLPKLSGKEAEWVQYLCRFDYFLSLEHVTRWRDRV